MSTYDNVNHPRHYVSHPSGVEVIQITEHMNFCLGNAIKYILRSGIKSDTTTVEDLRKAVWYIEREIARVEVADALVQKKEENFCWPCGTWHPENHKHLQNYEPKPAPTVISPDVWLQYGIDHQYCSKPYCNSHEGPPMSETEEARWVEDDPCLIAVRLGNEKEWK
jgi:hypothetical protein